MFASILQYQRKLPVWLSAAVWLAVLLSPTAYILLLITMSKLQMAAPPAWFIVALFCVIPVVAMVVCWSMVWFSRLRGRWRVGWLVVTVLAMTFQVGVLLLMIVSALTVAISPAQ